MVRRALKNDGIVLQWIGSHTQEEYLLQLRTFLSVFPETTLSLPPDDKAMDLSGLKGHPDEIVRP